MRGINLANQKGCNLMFRIQSGERVAIVIAEAKEAERVYHRGELHSQVKLTKATELLLQERGTNFSESSPHLLCHACEINILQWLKDDYPELQTININHYENFLEDDNRYKLPSFVQAYIALFRQEKKRQEWDSCRILSERFISALNGKKNAKHGLEALFRNRFPGHFLTLEEKEKMEERRLFIMKKPPIYPYSIQSSPFPN